MFHTPVAYGMGCASHQIGFSKSAGGSVARDPHLEDAQTYKSVCVCVLWICMYKGKINLMCVA